jgi:hypothetical protein
MEDQKPQELGFASERGFDIVPLDRAGKCWRRSATVRVGNGWDGAAERWERC